MKIGLTSIPVDDQAKALKFYTEKLGFVVKNDMDAGGGRWLTVTSPEGIEGVELLLEPMGIEAARVYQKALRDVGMPVTVFFSSDLDAECARAQGARRPICHRADACGVGQSRPVRRYVREPDQSRAGWLTRASSPGRTSGLPGGGKERP